MNRFIFCCWCILLMAFSGLNAKAELLISEFLADNRAGLMDEDGERPDWVEIFNSGNESVGMAGYYLTDDPAWLTRWKFPSTNIAAKGFLTLFASGKDRAVMGKPLHANFSLSAGGEYLALVNTDGLEILFEYAPLYPKQGADVSYGLAGLDGGSPQFFVQPTPGAMNPINPLQPAAAVLFSPGNGAFTNTCTVKLTTSEINGVIRYTTNGKAPTSTSTLYTFPLQYSSTTVVRSRVFAEGKAPGPIRTETFTILDSTAAAFSSNLPVMVLSSFGIALNETTKQPVSFQLVEPSKENGRTTLGASASVEGRGTAKYRGSSSLGFPKHSLAFEAVDEVGDGRDVSFLGMPKESDWVLYAPYTEKTMMRDVLSYELFAKMGHYSVRTRYVEVFLDTTGGKLLRSDYVGVYVLMEKIKRGKNRLDIEEILPSQNSNPEVTGGYIFKKDRLDPGDSGFVTSRQTLAYVEPKEQIITPLQKKYVSDFFASFETALYGTQFKDTTNGWVKFIDARSFIDTHLLVEGAKNIDGYRLSSYMFKDRGGKLQMGPAWDFNLAFGNADYLEGWRTNGWYYASMDDGSYPWYGRLFQDIDFKQLWIDRWAEVRQGPWSTDALLRSVDEKMVYLAESQVRNYQKWPILGTYVWPNWYIGKTYGDEVTWMKQWITGRMAWMDSQNQKPPTFSLAAGSIANPSTLSMTGASSLVYYTRDGTDPRTSGGGISSRASSYSGSITLTNNARIVARARASSLLWSAPIAATYVTEWPTVVITELMYHPQAGAPEFIEICNTGSKSVSLLGFKLLGGIEFNFSNGAIPILAKGERAVIVNDLALFQRSYGNTNRVAGVFKGSLNNDQNRVQLEGSLGEPILDFLYDDDWYKTTDGFGFSLVVRNEAASRQDWTSKTSWRPSSSAFGNPGVGNVPSQIPEVHVNEVLANSEAPLRDFIELRNPNNSPVNIGGWFITDDPREPNKHRIPDGTFVPANGFLVLHDANYGNVAQPGGGFHLDRDGDGVFIFSANTAGQLTGFSDGFEFGAVWPNVSIGKENQSGSSTSITPQNFISLGQANAGPKVGPVVITEIFTPYSLAEEPFIELKNLGQEEVRFTSLQTESRWRLNGIDFEFPTNAVIAPAGLMLIVHTNPAAFRARYQIPSTVPILGPYVGQLKNEGDLLELQQPKIDAGGTGAVTTVYVTMDQVNYRAGRGWPASGATSAWSAERIFKDAFGDDGFNWRIPVGGPSPGFDSKGSPNLAPRIDLATTMEVTQGLPVQLFGKVVEDWFPTGKGLSIAWKQLTGPGECVIESPSRPETWARFWNQGTYLLRLHAHDGLMESTADIQINVKQNIEYKAASGLLFTSSELTQIELTNPGGDFDGDGLRNVDELLAGTNLREPTSRLQLATRFIVENEIELHFDGQPNRWYAIQRRDNLPDSRWTTVTNQIGTGANEVHFPLAKDSQYYRLVLLP